MLNSTSRAVLRRPHVFLTRSAARQNSASSQAAQAASAGASKASEAASTATSKASQGLSRVSSSTSPAITNAAKSASSALKRIGGRTGRLISFVESMIPPAIYYSKVGYELGKLVFQGQKMSPPPLATFQSYFQPFLRLMRRPTDLLTHTANPSHTLNPMNALSRMRNLSTQQMAVAAVVAAEMIGFFTVGEMVGRFKLIGYRGEKEAHH